MNYKNKQSCSPKNRYKVCHDDRCVICIKMDIVALIWMNNVILYVNSKEPRIEPCGTPLLWLIQDHQPQQLDNRYQKIVVCIVGFYNDIKCFREVYKESGRVLLCCDHDCCDCSKSNEERKVCNRQICKGLFIFDVL